MRIFLILGLALSFLACQTTQEIIEIEEIITTELPADTLTSKVKLVVGITVDQMRADFIDKYWDEFGEDGFKKLIKDGTWFRNHHFTYAPTYTGPGHASIYTGTTPAGHGVISNDWFDKNLGHSVYCTSDSTVMSVGTSDIAGKMSPHRMLSSTFGDELRLYNHYKSKSIGVSLKDRGAILPAGHSANAAYWFHGKTEGKWISSTYYMNELPEWVQLFNASGKATAYMDTPWDLLKPESAYDASITDNNQYETPFVGQIRPVFPYDLRSLEQQNNGFDLLKATPAGNDLTVDFALAALEGEALGADEHCDLLTISFSATDYVGHQFGPQSREAQDTYLRLDQSIARLLKELDESIGKDNYLVFLTADHGAVSVPNYLLKNRMQSGYWNPDPMLEDVRGMLNTTLGVGEYIRDYSNDQFFLDHEALAVVGADLETVQDLIARRALQHEGVYMTTTATTLTNSEFTEGPMASVQRGFMEKRSGDVIVITNPAWLKYGPTGTSHGSVFAYDQLVPFILYGAGIPEGKEVNERSAIRDIAPTLSNLLHISHPNAATGRVLTPLIYK